MRRLSGLLALGMMTAACATTKTSPDPRQRQGEVETETTPAAPTGGASGDVTAQGSVEASFIGELAACRGNLTDTQLADSVLLAYDADASIHELIACGGLTIRVAAGLITGVVGMVLDDEDAMPAGLRFEGSGVYVSESQLGQSSMRMEVRLYERVGDEYVLAEADLFDAKNYLVGVEVDADASASVDFDIDDPLGTNVDADASVVIRYEEAGPWAKLLGLGDPPPNPIEVSDIAAIDPDFSDIYVETAIEIRDVKGGSEVRLGVKTELIALVDLFDAGVLDYQVSSLEASNSELRQTLEMRDWQVSYAKHGVLNGAVSFEVASRASVSVNYEATLTYEASAYGTVSLACAE